MKNVFFDDLWGCNLESNKWDKVSVAGAKPPPVAEHTLSHVNGKLYLWGGMNAGVFPSGSVLFPSWLSIVDGRLWLTGPLPSFCFLD
jgi:hypothetical protein